MKTEKEIRERLSNYRDTLNFVTGIFERYRKIITLLPTVHGMDWSKAVNGEISNFQTYLKQRIETLEWVLNDKTKTQ